MTLLYFSKMHGLGNDFVIINGINNQSQNTDLKNIPVKQLADRHVGIGFDQLLIILPSKKADFACQIFNADGSEAEQCGNGMRCVARFIHENKLTTQKSFSIDTKAGITNILINNYEHNGYEQIEVNMGYPRFDPFEVPFKADRIRLLYEIPLEDGQPGFALSVLSMGNPHAILQIASVKTFPVGQLGPVFSTHPLFPHGTNVGFMEIVNPAHIRLRTFERGSGETLACGSNACAAVVAGIRNHLLGKQVKVELSRGNLWVQWNNEKAPVILTGPATQVFSGSMQIN